MKIPFLPHNFLGNQTVYLEFFLKNRLEREREREREDSTFPAMDWISNSSSWWLEGDELSEMVSDHAELSVS
jgi:hypothetical protein